MDEREDPRARLRALCPEGGCVAPDREETLLHRVLGEPVVPQDAHGKAVGDAANAVVKLSERVLVTSRDERHQGFVGEVGVLLAHGPGRLGGER